MVAKKRKERIKVHEPSEIIIWARFWRLTVIDIRRWEQYHNRQILCKCDCGKEVATTRWNICHWQESCSCKQYEDSKIRAYKHWMGGTWKWWRTDRFYTTYNNIIARTRRPVWRYKCYEGIKCMWNSFEEFKNDMYESYLEHIKEYWEKDTTIDRIDVNGNYCKENCRWATIDEQAWNKNQTLKAIVDGKVYRSCDIAKIAWIWLYAAQHRIKKFLDNEWDKEKLLVHKIH